MRALLIITLAGVSLQAQAQPPQPAAPPPATDIYLLSMAPSGLESLKSAKPLPLSVAPGYDNQPAFSPDGRRVLLAANRDGAQTDVFVFDREGSRVSQLTRTKENENSPTYLPAGVGDPGGFSVVRTEPDKTQRLWRFDGTGGNPQVVLAEIKPVGYHAWVDAERLALFVLGPPATLRIASMKTGTAEVAADNIGRSLHRIANTRHVSFVHREASGEYWIKRIDVDTRKIEPLVKAVEGSAERDMAWLPDGKTILMSSSSKIFSWTLGAAGWTEVFDTAPHSLGAVTRLAVAPSGDALALVVNEPKR